MKEKVEVVEGGGEGGGGGGVAVVSFAQHVAIVPDGHNLRLSRHEPYGAEENDEKSPHTISGSIFEFETSEYEA